MNDFMQVECPNCGKLLVEYLLEASPNYKKTGIYSCVFCDHQWLSNSQQTINQISKFREQNNRNWMNILKLAFKYAPKEAKEIMADISKCDQEINKLTKELAE